MRVKPAPNPDDPEQLLRVRFPGRQGLTRLLRPEGEEVPDDDLEWHRRLLHGDIVPCEAEGDAQ